MDIPSPERTALEADMKTLAAEIRSQQERPEIKNMDGREIVKEALRVFPEFQKNQNNPSGTPIPATPASLTGSLSPLPAYVQNAPASVKLEIEYLIDVALRKGIGAAFTEAGKSPFFVQDAFHDALAGRLYPELKKEGFID